MTWVLPISLTALNLICVMKVMRKTDAVKEDILDTFEGFVTKAANFYATEKQDFMENAPKLLASALHAPVMSQLGKMSGISRQMKGMEKDLMSDGISAATGNPSLGPLVAKYAQKYPLVAQMLPMLMQGRLKTGAGPRSNSKLGEI